MENKKKKWRLSLFDIIFIAVILVAAVLFVFFSSRSDSGVGIISAGTQETVTYTIVLERMLGDSAYLITPGDELVDRVENRMMGTVVSVDILPATMHQPNINTGDRVLSELPGVNQAIVVVTANATVTDNQISIGGFVVRAGVSVSVNGPLYSGSGFIVDIERGAA